MKANAWKIKHPKQGLKAALWGTRLSFWWCVWFWCPRRSIL